LQELQVGDHAVTRSLFDRATSLSLSTKKMKFLFKRYLDFERTEGDAATQERVRTKARQYIESKTGAA
jgi:rRNA biogenesis protein RRP5